LLSHAEKFVKQLKVSLPDALRELLDAVSAKSGNSVSELIRVCVQRAYSQQLDPPTQRLMHLIGALAVGAERQVGKPWHADPAAHFVFQRAIEILLGRRKPAGDLVPLNPAELPTDRPVAITTDLEAMAAGLEAIISLSGFPQDIGQVDRSLAGGPTTLREVTRKKEDKS
jgi:hypothetical protein